MTETYTCPCCGKPYTKQDAERLFMQSFLSNDLEGISHSNRMKITIMHEDFKRYSAQPQKLNRKEEP